MGGGVSRLEETLWEEDGTGSVTNDSGNDNDNDNDGNNNDSHRSVADGGLHARNQTIDGVAPTHRYRYLEVQKTHLGQREYEIVDARTQTVLYRTISVPGTLAWFDVVRGTAMGDRDALLPSDFVVRVQALDHLRRTWMVYKYHHPVFVGQRPISPHHPACKGVPSGLLLYKTACLTVSWSRYVIVAARYGKPQPEDWQEQTTESESESDELEPVKVPLDEKNETENDPVEKEQSSNNYNNNSENNEDDDDEEFITPREMVQLTKSEEERQSNPANAVNEKDPEDSKPAASTSSTIRLQYSVRGGVEEYKTESDGQREPEEESPGDHEEEEEDSEHAQSKSNNNQSTTIRLQYTFRKGVQDCNINNAADEETNTEQMSKRRSPESLAQTKRLRAYFGDTTTNARPKNSSTADAAASSSSEPEQSLTTSVAAALSSKSSSLLQSGKSRLSAISRFSWKMPHNKEGTKDREESSTSMERPPEAGEEPAPSSSSEAQPPNHSESSSDGAATTHPEDTNDAEETASTDPEETTAEMPVTPPTLGDDDDDDEVAAFAASCAIDDQEIDKERQPHTSCEAYELAMQGVLDLDGDQPIVQCQEISNKMLGNHQTFCMTKEDLLALLKLEQTSRDKPDVKEVISSELPQNDSNSTSIADEPKRFGWKSIVSAAKAKVTGTSDSQNSTSNTADETPQAMGESEGGSAPADNANTLTTKVQTNETSDSAVNSDCQAPSTPIAKEASPGDGVEECKEEPEDEMLETPITPAADAADAADAAKTATPQPEAHQASPPLVSYFFWKHTSMNLGKHKMHMHLAQNSDLALHVVLAIVSNQVRSERNHAFFLTTGLHPSWFYIDPRNPRATIS